MSKSNVNGGGRGAYSSKGGAIVGDVINHGTRARHCCHVARHMGATCLLIVSLYLPK